MQKPTIGRIVHILVSTESNNGADVAPAIITRAWRDDLVNLRILNDGDDLPWLTSVPLLADEEAARSLHDERLATQLTHTAVAFWPSRS